MLTEDRHDGSILRECKQHIRFVITCMRYNLAREMENRGAFIAQVLGMVANNAIMLLQWVILFSFTDNIGGYAFNDVVLLWGLSASTFGFAHMLFMNVRMLPGYITGGKLDAYLVQPKNALINVACGRMGVSAIGDLLYGLVLALIVRRSLSSLLLFMFFTATGGIVLTAFYTLSGCLAFWLTHSEDLSDSLNGIVVNFATYPEGLFDGMAKWLLFTLIPVGFTVYVPMRFFMTFEWRWCAAALAFASLLTAAAFFVFGKGLKRYSSSNIMSARI